MEGSCSERGDSRFWRSGKGLSWSFIWRSFRQVAVALSPGQKSPCLWRVFTRWFGGCIQSFPFWQGLLYLLYLRFLLVSWFYDLLQGWKGEKFGLFVVFTEWSNRRSPSYQSSGSSTSLCWADSYQSSATLSDWSVCLWSLRASWASGWAISSLFQLVVPKMEIE